MKPNLTNIAAWIAALRSGQYRQGRKYLKTEDRAGLHYCCLGVACELHLGPSENDQGYHFWKNESSHSLSLADSKLDEIFGMDMRSVIVSTGMKDEYVQALNDEEYSFKEIAGFIERKFLPNMRHS